jgi:chloride channel 3/4/5
MSSSSEESRFRPRLSRSTTDWAPSRHDGLADPDTSSLSPLRGGTPILRSRSVVIQQPKLKRSTLGSLLVKAKDITAALKSPAVSSYTLRTRARMPPLELDSSVSYGGEAHPSPHGAPIRSFYDDFTTVDWVHETVVESSRRKYLRSLPGMRGKIIRLFDAVQGWLLITIVAFVFALVAYVIDICEEVLTDLRHGYCSTNLFTRQSLCCPHAETVGGCKEWISWSQYKSLPLNDAFAFDLVAYLTFTVGFALISVLLTLRTKTDVLLSPTGDGVEKLPHSNTPLIEKRRVIYSGTGSGVAEVKTILSGFIMRRFLGTYTLINKSIALVFAISSGLSIGKEGPYVHLATCVGNISCRLFKKFNENDIKRRQVLSAAAGAGVALAFGSPLGGVLFSLEEVSYYFLPHQLFRIFFCAMISALFLKFMDPYKTGKIVLFEVSYPRDWQFWVCRRRRRESHQRAAF